VLLGLDDPTKVIARQEECVPKPSADWELVGDVNKVVFTCGAVLPDRESWVYYGAADSVMGPAKGNIDDVLADVA